MSQSREMLGSRLGFLLLSAGCAIGLGNVWRFPYITGAYGGAVFVGVYLLCLLADFQPLGAGTCVLDLEDFLISNNILPLGGLFFLLFCCLRRGWGWDNFIAEVDQGVGMKFPRWLRGYVTYVLPCLIIFVFVMGYVDKFWK